MIQKLKSILKRYREGYRIPRCVRDVIPIQKIWEDGIFRVGNRYSKTFGFTDISYQSSGKDEKFDFLKMYADVINTMDSTAVTKITVFDHPITDAEFERDILIPTPEDCMAVFRQEYNQMLQDKRSKANGVLRDLMITVTTEQENHKAAEDFFTRIAADLETGLSALGSYLEQMDAKKRLQIIHNFFRKGDEEGYRFDIKEDLRHGHDFRDRICPDRIEKHSDYLRLGDRYARAMYMKDYGTYVKDSMIASMTSVANNMMLSIDIIPIANEEATRMAMNKQLAVETNIANWQRRQNRNGNYAAEIPYDMELQRAEMKEFLKDMCENNQRMLLTIVSMVITADSKEELDSITEQIKTIAQNSMSQAAVLKYQQLDGLITAMPFGVCRLTSWRTLTTGALAALLPFKVPEVMEKGGIYYGENAITRNLILCNTENLMNQSSIFFGVPGSGKSFFAKFYILLILMNTKDDIIICDPEGEYSTLTTVSPDESSVIHIVPGGKDHLNPFDLEDGYGEDNPFAAKCQFIQTLVEQLHKDKIIPEEHKAIIDRCSLQILKEAKENGTTPTLCTLRELLLEQPEPEAAQIVLYLERYTTGTLDLFAHETNVDLSKRLTIFDIHSLGEQLKAAGLLVITDTMLNRVNYNARHGKRTHIIIDEYHIVFDNEHSRRFFTSAWRQFRKRNAQPTAITQNVQFMNETVESNTMLSNSEMVVMLNQSPHDRDILKKLLHLSDRQLKYITNVAPGSGLIRYGGALIPFQNQVPKDTEIYRLMTTKPGERTFGGE